VPEGASRLTGLSVQSGSDPSGPRKPLSRRLLRLVVSPVLQLVQQLPALRDEEESIWKMWRHPSGIWDMSREPLCRYLDMRRAGTMGGPFLLRRLSGVGGEPGPLVCVGEGSYPTGVLLIPF
jgi:hypothetical protein